MPWVEDDLGALGETRTPTPRGTSTSSLRVYQIPPRALTCCQDFYLHRYTSYTGMHTVVHIDHDRCQQDLHMMDIYQDHQTLLAYLTFLVNYRESDSLQSKSCT